MVEYLSGNRIQGSSTLTSSPPQTSWKEIDRKKLTSNGDSIDCNGSGSGFPAKDYLMFIYIINRPSSGDQNIRLRFNGDANDNYAESYSLNGGANTTAHSQNNIALHSGVVNENFGVFFVNNVANKEKFCIGEVVGTGTDASSGECSRREQTLKWVNTSDQVTRIELVNTSTGEFETDSELIVLGCDQDEANSGTTYWQELANVTGTASAATLTTGTITAKKFLKFHIFHDEFASGGMRFNQDSSSLYKRRYSANGASDTINNTDTKMSFLYDLADAFTEGYIINIGSRAKLMMFSTCETNNQTGTGNRLYRMEGAIKWHNLSDQITEINLFKGSNFSTAEKMIVWGAD